MHIAVCDDNIADRKQMERLLKREAQKHETEYDTFFADSYGNASALLKNPMQYDIFFLDMCQSGEHATRDLVTLLGQKGILSPIVLCSSQIDYTKDSDYPDNVLFLEKPIQADLLSLIIKEAYLIKKKLPPSIELRDEEETFYVTASDILYAVRHANIMSVHLSGGRVTKLRTTLMNLYSQWSMFEQFLPLSGSVIINLNHISNYNRFHVTMSDGQQFHVPVKMMGYIAEYWKGNTQ